MDRYLTTKGLYLRAIDPNRYILENIFGVCTLPFPERVNEFKTLAVGI